MDTPLPQPPPFPQEMKVYVIVHPNGVDTIYADEYDPSYGNCNKGYHNFFIDGELVGNIPFNVKRGQVVLVKRVK